MIFASTDIEWESTAGAQVRITDFFPSGSAAPPIVTVKATTPNASDAGPVDGVFTVAREGSTTASLLVNYTISGTAKAGQDYTALTGSVTILVGSATATITVAPLDDGVPTGAETVVLTLASSANYTLAGQMADTATIAAHDPPTVSIAGSGTASESVATATFTVSRTLSESVPLTVYYTVSGTANNGADYQWLGGSLSIPVGSSSQTITVAPTGSQFVEGTETIVLTLSPNPGYVISAANHASVGLTGGSTAPTAFDDREHRRHRSRGRRRRRCAAEHAGQFLQLYWAGGLHGRCWAGSMPPTSSARGSSRSAAPAT